MYYIVFYINKLPHCSTQYKVDSDCSNAYCNYIALQLNCMVITVA